MSRIKQLEERVRQLEALSKCQSEVRYNTDGSVYHWPFASANMILMDGVTTFFWKCPVCCSLFADRPAAVACCAREKQKQPYADRPESVIMIPVRSSWRIRR